MMVLPLLALGGAWLAGVVQIVVRGGSFVSVALSLVAFTLGCVLVVVAVVLKFGRPSGFVVVGPRGVGVYRGRGGLDEYTWDRVGEAHVRIVRKTLDVVIDGRPVIIPGFLTFRGNVLEAQRCAQYINACRRNGGKEADHVRGGRVVG
jgi:hypothetical protein